MKGCLHHHEAVKRARMKSRFWQLVEPDPDQYSRWLDRLMEFVPVDKLEEIVESMEDPNACRRCGSKLQSGRCTDETCPFSDCEQTDPAGWTGHPDYTDVK
jgi:hypothetical protein